jgi:hypothetical protein
MVTQIQEVEWQHAVKMFGFLTRQIVLIPRKLHMSHLLKRMERYSQPLMFFAYLSMRDTLHLIIEFGHKVIL